MRILRIAIAILLCLPTLVIAAGNSLIQYQRCPDDTCTNGWLLGPPSADSAYIYDKATEKPSLVLLPGAMAVSSGALVFNGSSSQYVRGDGVLATLPTSSRSFSYTTRSLNTCFQISSTRDAFVSYAVEISVSLSLTAGQAGTVYLRTYTNSGCSTGAQELTRFVNGNTGTLTIGLALTQNVSGTLTGMVPAGLWAQLVTENNTGTPTFTSRPGQEVLL